MPIRSITVAALVAAAPILAHAEEASDQAWPQWRGPSRDGQVHGSPWPEKLAERLERVWRVDELGPSYSGPVVDGGTVYTTSTHDKKREVVRAFDLGSGSPKWDTTWDGAMSVPFFAAKNGSWIRSTPAFADGRLYIAGMRDVLVCLDAADGSEVWRVDFTTRYGTPLPDFGFVCSPLVVDDHVYVQAGASFCKLDAESGETIWRTLDDGGGMFGSAFSSPVMATIDGRTQLVVLTRATMNGIDPDDGGVIWSLPVKSFRGMNILTPIIVNDAVFTATYGGNTQLIGFETEGETITPAKKWDTGVQGYMTSPVVIDGHVYFFTRSNRFTCVRLSDGKRMWTSSPTGDDYWSLVANGDRILALNDSGMLRLIKATPDSYDVVDEMEIAEAQTWAHVAVVGKHIVVREQDALSVWAWN